MRRILAAMTLCLFAAVGMAIFQNCSQPAEGLKQASYQDFAVESKLDTMAYMSCSGMSAADPQAYFTFRAGAYDRGGMRLSEDFYNATARMTTGRAVQLLVNGTKHGDLQLQMSIRRSSDLVIFKKAEAPEINSDYANIFPTVNAEELAAKLVELGEGERVNRLSGAFESLGRFEGNLSFFDNTFLEESVRSEIRKGAFLALTYSRISTEEGQETLAISPADFSEDPSAADFNFAYGTGYRLNFQQGNIGTGHPARVLASVDEVDLESKTRSGSNWSCPASMRFKIVRPEDIGAVDENGNQVVQCDRVLDPNVLSPEEAAVRRVLKTEHWWIDMQNRCAIPKPGVGGFCYGEALDIEYDNGPCSIDSRTGVKACTHFVSVCTASL